MASTPLVWLITGANAGFGLELSLLALSQNHTVIATARDLSKVPQSLKDAGAHLVETELTVPATKLQAIVDDVVRQHGRIDVLVNNAGYCLAGTVEDLDDAQCRHQLDVNFFALLSLTRAAIPHMRQQRSGVIVQLSSLAGLMGGAGYSLYSASKFAIEGLSEGLAAEVRPFNVRIHVVEPGYFRTSFLNRYARGEMHENSSSKIEGYPDLGGMLKAVDGNQPGDPKKGMQRLYEVVTGTGLGAGKEWELRIPLGSDIYGLVDTKLKDMSSSLASMKDIALSTDLS